MEDLQLYKKVEIDSKINPYTVLFTQSFEQNLKAVAKEGDILIVDQFVKEHYGHLWEEAALTEIVLVANENQKSYHAIEDIIDQIVAKGFRRNNRLIAIGGGIIQDVTSFISHIIYRGVDWLFFPTNLLSQCDSCIGSKLSVNLGKYKNIIGGFYPPKEIYIDINFLKTLSHKDILSGLGEMLHYFLIDGRESATIFVENVPKVKENLKEIDALIFRSLAIKKTMIEKDEFDQGPRNIFNYGHTFGHALESVTNYSIPHGIAVSLGIDLANLVSVDLGLISMQERNEMRQLCKLVFEEIQVPNFDLHEYERALRKDKKNEGNTIGLILTNGIGKAFKRQTAFESIQARVKAFYEEQLYRKDL